MKILSAVLVLVAAASSFGAVISFTGAPTVAPGGSLPVAVFGSVADVPASGFAAVINVGLTTSGGTESFAFDGGLPTGSNFTKTVTGNGTASVLVNGFYTSALVDIANGTKLGTLTITAPTAAGQYVVSTTGDLNYYNADEESYFTTPVSGSFAFTVTPEPATMALLALGGLLIARRRHA